MRGLIFFFFCPLLLAQSHWVDTASTVSIDVRMVEIYAAVLDHRGKNVTGLTANNFEVIEDGFPQRISVFQPGDTTLTTALLIDSTGSMLKDLPHVKNAVATLLNFMKPDDRIGLYAFASRLTTLQPFTQDRASVLRAVMRTRASGNTALFDALTQLSSDVSRVTGKRVILLFTDGADNCSVVSREAAVRNIKRIGIPVYAVAEGGALKSKPFMQCLTDICTGSGGLVFQARKADELARIFEIIARDLQHLYLIGYYPQETSSSPWHSISLRLPQLRDLKVRAKEGYWQ
jgi:Ca-activated chloride channel homolog